MADPKSYLSWLDAATSSGLRLACLGDVAPPEPSAQLESFARVFARLGLRNADQYVRVTHKAKVVSADKDMTGFEQPLDKVLPEFPVIEPISAATRIHLSVSVPDAQGVDASVLIATGPGGGYVADGYTIYYDQTSDKVRWVVNPFAFFSQALGDERFPIPDVTTLAGRRMYFSHIDGDGWNNISEIEGYRELQATAAEAIRKEAIEPYPDLPVSVGLIAGDAVPEIGGLEATRDSAAKLFALPQVEVASHTYTHPFTWGFFSNYDRQSELALIEQANRPSISVMDRVRSTLYKVAGKAESSAAGNRYIAGTADLPRGYLTEPFDLEKEVKGALELSESLAPPGKKAAIYLWSGDTEPDEAAVRATRLAGVVNMNGGDTRLDTEFPSVFYVPPIARPVGAERQIYAANSNENTYTNNWKGPFYGQLMLEQTLGNTETPRRLKPFNLYYHMYSGEKPGALKAITHLLDLARASRVIPVTASRYAQIAGSFYDVEIEQYEANSWKIANRGALQTFRFDNADDLEIDFVRSGGVLGSNRANGALYVSLDAAVEPATIVLVKMGAAEAQPEPGQAFLVDSRWNIVNLRQSEGCGFKVDAQGFGPGDMIWRAVPHSNWEAVASRAGRDLARGKFQADGAGLLHFALAVDAMEPLSVQLACEEQVP